MTNACSRIAPKGTNRGRAGALHVPQISFLYWTGVGAALAMHALVSLSRAVGTAL